MTIYEIKDRVVNAPKFFSPGAMKFFNQTLRSFSVEKVEKNVYYISAPSYWDNRLMGYTKRWFNTETNKLYSSLEAAMEDQPVLGE